MLTEEELEAMYGAWMDDMAAIYETTHYGHSRAAFYAGAAAERERILRLAVNHDARYTKTVLFPVDSVPPTTEVSIVDAPFADLLTGDADSTATPDKRQQ